MQAVIDAGQDRAKNDHKRGGVDGRRDLGVVHALCLRLAALLDEEP